MTTLALKLSPRRPLLTVDTVVALLDMDRIEVLEHCDSGRFAWAFDLSTPGSSRREVRIWRGSVFAWNGEAITDPTSATAEADVFTSIIPPQNPRSSDLARRFGVGRDQLRRLIESGHLEIAAAPTRRQGVNAACRLRRSSVLSFLRRRRIGAKNPLAIFPR